MTIEKGFSRGYAMIKKHWDLFFAFGFAIGGIIKGKPLFSLSLFFVILLRLLYDNRLKLSQWREKVKIERLFDSLNVDEWEVLHRFFYQYKHDVMVFNAQEPVVNILVAKHILKCLHWENGGMQKVKIADKYAPYLTERLAFLMEGIHDES